MIISFLPLFDLALYNYAQKWRGYCFFGIQHFINRVFLTTAQTTGTIQAVKVLTTLTECADSGIPIVENLLNKHRAELVQIERKWHAVYENCLIVAQDLTDNLPITGNRWSFSLIPMKNLSMKCP